MKQTAIPADAAVKSHSLLSPVLVFVFFFGSGFAALIYQIVWLKYLNLVFGSTTYATAAVIAAFMCGLSLGSRLAPGFPRFMSSSLKAYGVLEMAIGVFALTFPYLYSNLKIPFAWIFNAIGPQTYLYNALTFLIAFAFLLIPTALMGATLPLLSHYLITSEEIGEKSGILYAVNTAGAVCGVLISAFLLIPNLGLRGTVQVGVLINLLAGLICYLAGRLTEVPVLKIEKTVQIKDRLLWIYGFSGLLAIAYEVLWTRLLVLHLGSSVYAFAIMLAVFLVGISLGSLVSGKFLTRTRIPASELFMWIQIGWAFSILLQLIQFVFFSDTLSYLAGAFGGLTVTTHFMVLAIATFQLLILPTCLSGALFPLVVTELWKKGNPIQDAVSLSYSYNTVGGILGSLLTGFLLLPLLGTQSALILLAAMNLTTGILAVRRENVKVWKPVFFSVVFVVSALYLNGRINIVRSAGIFQEDGQATLLRVEEDTTATITVEKRKYLNQSYDSLSVNGVNVAGTSPNLISIQKMQAHLPLMIYGPLKQKHVLHIGFGSGGTAYSVSLYPHTRITVVEISKAVVRNAHAYFDSVNHGVAQSGMLNFIYFDGRSYLQNTKAGFDVILSDSIHPRYSGNGSLYTKDYYEIVYSRLNEGGVHSQWIPIYSVAPQNLQEILKAFGDVFSEPSVWYINSTINPYIIITGRKNASGISSANFRQAFSIPDVSKDLKSISMFDEYFLLDHFFFGQTGLGRYVSDVEPHIDDRLSVEYESSRIINRQLSWYLNFEELFRRREPVYPYLISSDPLIRVNYDRFFEATKINLDGHLYFVAGKRDEANKAFAEAFSRNKADREPLEYFQALY